MSETPEAQARTRMLARVIGPFFVIVPPFIAFGTPSAGAMVSSFFANAALVLISAALVLLLGLLIIANHNVWSSPAAFVISLLGWLMALRGVMLLAVPGWAARVATSAIAAGWIVPTVAIILALVGLWLTFVGWVSARPSRS
jgi:hypothetical protein